MPLPPRPFHCLNDIAIRWSVMPLDIVGWATDGMIALSMITPPVKTASARLVSGLVEIPGADAFPLFRRDGAESINLHRVRESPDAKWEWIADPAQGVKTGAADILITRTEVEKFEQQHGLFGSSDNLRAAHRLQRKPGPGVPPRYEWDAFYAAIARRVHEHGIPKTQAELIREMLDWFEQRGNEHAPDESTVRRKVAVVWRELTRTGP
jgi:hypothetical protein